MKTGTKNSKNIKLDKLVIIDSVRFSICSLRMRDFIHFIYQKQAFRFWQLSKYYYLDIGIL